MKVSEAVQLRRAVKAFDPDHRMSEAEIDRLMSLALLSPTAWNIQHWRFVLLRDPALRRQVRAAAWDQAQVTDASLLVVLTADVQAWRKEPARYWRNAEPGVRDWLVGALTQFYTDRDWLQRDDAMRSCGIAAQTLMLAAQELGYQSCPMDGFDFDAVAKLINLPADHAIAMFVAVGKGVQEARPRGGQLALEEVVLTDRFN
ncbi:MAG TPA: nitroreductase family protein [Rhodocyclaceae bacterium]|nr:nitroreductase family protein [Rhodocyclaceae bacterium]